MSTFLRLENVHRSFGRVQALCGLSLSIPEKSVTAFVGSNGAGKTTTFALIGRFIRPHAGTITIRGQSINEYWKQGGTIGLLPQDMQFFEDRTVFQQLNLFSRLAGLGVKEAKREVARVLELTNLKDKIHSKPRELSRGMHVRLGIAQALLASPELVLLDEPTAGLDPKMIRLFRSVVDELRGKTTLVISSHDLSELEQMCDYVCMIEKGKLVREGAMHETLSSVARVVYEISSAVSLDKLREILPDSFRVESADKNRLLVSYASQTHRVAEVNQLVLRALFELGVDVLSVRPGVSLEEAFLDITDGSD